MTTANPQQARTYRGDGERWTAVLGRDAGADGQFYYSVATTGVYCRPSCAARPPRRENVRFHDSPEAAERAGFRPCKRCRPDQPAPEALRAEKVAAACRAIEAAEELPSLDDLAGQAGLSRYHFHRLFKRVTGVTPRQYGAAARARRLRDALPQSDSVTQAIYDSGFNSSGHFYAEAGHLLGMTPSAFRHGGRGAAIRFALGRCSLGTVLVAATQKGVCAIMLGDDSTALARELHRRFPNAELIEGDGDFARTLARVVALIEAPGRPAAELPLDIRGTAFQQRVWQALRAIPAGSTRSYAELAAAIGRPKAVRAVAQACAANPVAVAVPCHRVVASDGKLAGYRWGVERKRELLKREVR